MTNIRLYWLNDRHEKDYIEFIDNERTGLWINSCEKGIYNFRYNGVNNQECRDYAMVNYLFTNYSVGLDSKTPSIADLEVMYVGQAFGRKQRRMIDYRLVNHEKIQQIALDVLNRGTNEEVLVIGQKVETNDIAMLLMTSDPKQGKLSGASDDFYGLKNKAMQRITEGQQVTVFEASLIRYFQPILNTEHKLSFPTPDFDSYDEIFKTDFDYSSFGLDSKAIGVRIFSEHVSERLFEHGHHFPLKTKSDKKSLFEFLVESSGLSMEDLIDL